MVVPLVIRLPIIVAAMLCAIQLTIPAGMANEVTTKSQESDLHNDTTDVSMQSDKNFTEEAEQVRHILSISEGFLAGEDTPVWIAYRPDNSTSVSYMKLKQGIVKEAMEYRFSGGYVGFTATKSRRSIVEEMVTKNLTKRSNPHAKVLYPTIMVMMDYTIIWPEDELAQQKLIYERILYALAFWNGVDMQLRHLQNPKVRLRIAGIVIGRNKEAAPYLRDSSGWLGLNVEPSLRQMLRYWRNLANVNKDFSASAYNAVAIMTDSDLSPGFFWTVAGIATAGPPCDSSGEYIAGLVLPDDNGFGGIQTAVHETGHLLGESGHDGDSDECPEETGYVHAPSVNNYGRRWSECSLKHISSRLRQTGWWCMSEPKEYHPPGKPVGIILPGKVMTASELCQARGWEDGLVCWEDTTCDTLYCSNNSSFSACSDAGLTPDGITCGLGKTCLDGRCISVDVLTFLWKSSFENDTIDATENGPSSEKSVN